MKKWLSVALSALLVTLLVSGCGETPAKTGLDGSSQRPENGAAQGGAPEQQKNTTPVEYSDQHTNMRLALREGWDYDSTPGAGEGEAVDAAGAADSFGIQFWPQAEPSMRISLRYYVNGIGLCGTGVTFEEISFENGLTATKCTEDMEHGFWFFLIYHDVPGAYAVECFTSKELWSEYESTLMSILESVEVGTGILSESEAIEIAKGECTVAYDTVRAYFDCVDGLWEVRFSTDNAVGGNQSIWIDAKGEVRDIVSEE